MAADTLGDDTPLRVDAPGDLSIVVQGGLSAANMVEIANHCRHWRALFPHAQIILALSGTDTVEGLDAAGVRAPLTLVPAQQGNVLLQAALDSLCASCDSIVLGQAQLPLPPIKADAPGLNHINLQIAAAQAGLDLARGLYVLRVRSDLLFWDNSFVQQYARGIGRPRGDAAILKSRVLLSWLYTLNPYTEERLPLHFSDWFHFGLTEDVRALWRVPFMTMPDAIHYQANPHSAASNAAERLFHVRLADEQHLMFHALRPHFSDLTLAYHNDPQSRMLALDILADNFVVCDLAAAKCVFRKYDQEFERHEKSLHCITADDWDAIVTGRNIDYRITLAHKIQEWRGREGFEFRQGFPRVYPASRLAPVEAVLLDGEIVSRTRHGAVCRGPRVAMPMGHYAATFVAQLSGQGAVTLRATREGGRHLLAEARMAVVLGSRPKLTLGFDLTTPDAVDVEITCTIDGLDAITISSLTLTRDVPTTCAVTPLYLSGTQLSLAVRKGSAATGPPVTVFTTPKLSLRSGRYQAALNPRVPAGEGRITLTVTRDGDVLAKKSFINSRFLNIGFVVGRPSAAIQISCVVEGFAPFEISHLLVADVTDEHGTDLPRYYEAAQLYPANGRFLQDRIAATARNGKLCYGPYATLGPGRYVATVDLREVGSSGDLTVTITTDVGTKVLAERTVRVARSLGSVALDFDVAEGGAWKLEVICTMRDVHRLSVTGLLLEQRSAMAAPTRLWRRIARLIGR